MSRFFNILLSDQTEDLLRHAAKETGTPFFDFLRLLLQADARAYGVEVGMYHIRTEKPQAVIPDPGKSFAQALEDEAVAADPPPVKVKARRLGQDMLAECGVPDPKKRVANHRRSVGR